jgi:hypothetical protein
VAVGGLKTGNLLLADAASGSSVNLTVSAAAARLPGGFTAYALSVVQQPFGYNCTSAASSSASMTGPVVAVYNCSYALSVSVSGVYTGSVVVANTVSGEALTFEAGGSMLQLYARYVTGYNLTVSSQPAGYSCKTAAAAAAGILSGPVTLSVVCTYQLGVTVTGLYAGAVAVRDTYSGQSATFSPANASSVYTFPVTVSRQNLTVTSAPAGYSCSAVGPAANLTGPTTVTIACGTYVSVC